MTKSEKTMNDLISSEAYNELLKERLENDFQTKYALNYHNTANILLINNEIMSNTHYIDISVQRNWQTAIENFGSYLQNGDCSDILSSVSKLFFLDQKNRENTNLSLRPSGPNTIKAVNALSQQPIIDAFIICESRRYDIDCLLVIVLFFQFDEDDIETLKECELEEWLVQMPALIRIRNLQNGKIMMELPTKLNCLDVVRQEFPIHLASYDDMQLEIIGRTGPIAEKRLTLETLDM